MFAGNAVDVIMTFMKYLLVLVFVLSVPSILLWVLLSGNASYEQFGLSEVVKLQIDEEMLSRLRRHYILGSEAFVVVVIVFLIWLWSKCPHDYGDRIRESYMANSVSAGQLTVRGRRNWRKVTMRIYFGKYPTQQMLDQHASARSHGQVARTVPISDLAASGGTGSGTRDAALLKKPNNTTKISFLIVVLSVVTMLDTALTWMGRAMAASEMVKVGEFCRWAPGPDESGAADYCSRQPCQKWAEDHGLPDGFCARVRWHDKVDDTSQIATCAYYGYSAPPCCGGCGIGEAMSFAKEGGWFAAFQELLGIVGDIGTLVFSLMAAASVVQNTQATDHFDVLINQVRTVGDETSKIELTMPTMLYFYDTVFDRAFQNADGEQASSRGHFQEIMKHVPASMASSPSSWLGTPGADVEQASEARFDTAGVSNFVKEKTCNDWDDFFERFNFAEAVDTWSYKVTVPMKCLGITDIEDEPDNPRAERVVAAWSERPRLEWSSLLVPICTAMLLMFVIVVCPTAVGPEESLILPGLPRSSIGRILSALAVGMIIVGGGFLYQYFSSVLNGTEHACIVTDQRVFYIRYRAPCCLLCNFGVNLRVDCFRHERNLTYANVTTNHKTLWQRLSCVDWVPGIITLQTKFGVLEFTRRTGNAFNVFNVISQLIPESGATFLSRGVDDADHAWDWDSTQSEAEGAFDKMDDARGGLFKGVRLLKAQPTDLVESGPSLYLVTQNDGGQVKELEQPLFHWSFQQVGALSTPFDSSTDLVITTGRVFLWSRSNYKKFDCKTSCCWGFCWCGWLSAISDAATQSNSVSFFTLPTLLSFSSTTHVDPPAWTDASHTPVKFPFYENLCSGLTKCVTCNFSNMGFTSLEDFASSCSCIPFRTTPRVQMWLLFRLKTCAQQADLMAAVMPFHHKDFEDVDLLDSLGCGGCCGGARQQTMDQEEPEHNRKITQLRAIMGVVQDLAGA
uniref:Uncharacterized protein n=1 Tax=Zooxanthella nutricula TaxID=1333877 RepID=A0A7S2NQN1_9DINO